MLLVLAQQGLVLLLLPGLLQQAGFSLTVFSVMLLPLLTAVHLTLLAHVYTSMQRARAAGMEAVPAIERMLREVFQSCVFAAVTTAAGLGSLLLSDVRPIREFGVMGCLGLGLVFFMTFGPGLALLRCVARFLPAGPRPGPSQAEEEGLRASGMADWASRLTGMVRKRFPWIAATAGLAVVVSVLGWSRIRTDIRTVEFLGHQSSTRQALEALDELYGGINVVRIEFDSGTPNGINDPAFLNYLETVRDHLASRAEVTGIYSYAQLLAMMNQIWEGGGTEAMKLPDSRLLIEVFVLALRSQNFPFLTTLADPSMRAAYLILRTRDMPADRYLRLLH
ncbi:MAG TPA: MMPL family transporter, partial [Verrucomicrobiae bacterium]|nr:MMPL family transporter [Verrucomicrobiae bacterium]